MSLNKNKMVREIGRRTRLKNRDVQLVLETLIDVWTEELVAGGRIELANFLTMECREIERRANAGILKHSNGNKVVPNRYHRRILVRFSKHIRQRLNTDE
ncbi:HU family DNA-binding protein [Phototrophicus methaneseepsis]|uniref:HU family DNA-binding protein n=1 Tax=Phototrophicus methaneseepsis TaxID=2710758 RepID=A0A7S8E9W8_9CHLR|nr:HU family DNA-binding protein [Phototrophicus methaneseepsis]QPC83061.1 HU family DNA-binding protein [Phototrophicus methaneseepsis]